MKWIRVKLHEVDKSHVTSSFRGILTSLHFFAVFFLSLSLSIGKRSTLILPPSPQASQPPPPVSMGLVSIRKSCVICSKLTIKTHHTFFNVCILNVKFGVGIGPKFRKMKIIEAGIPKQSVGDVLKNSHPKIFKDVFRHL